MLSQIKGHRGCTNTLRGVKALAVDRTARVRKGPDPLPLASPATPPLGSSDTYRYGYGYGYLPTCLPTCVPTQVMFTCFFGFGLPVLFPCALGCFVGLVSS